MIRALPSLITLLSAFALVSAAQAEQPPTRAPYDRPSPSYIQRTIINWLDNATVGGINTFVGGGNILIALIAKPIATRPGPAPQAPEPVTLGTSDKNHHEQIIVRNANFSPEWTRRLVDNPDPQFKPIWGYSLGVLNIGEGPSHEHEAGHSHESATLGPLYLPAVGLDYLLEKHDASFIENWANLEATIQDQYSLTFPVQIGAGALVTSTGSTLPYLLIRASIDERGETTVNPKDGDQSLQKVYEWLRTEVLVPVTDEARRQGEASPLFFEVNLLKKTMELTSATPEGHSLALKLRTEQDYARVHNLPFINIIHANALRWAVEAGLNYKFSDKIDTSLLAGFSVSGDGFVATHDGPLYRATEKGVSLGSAVRGRLDVTLFKYLTVYGMIEQYWLLNQYGSLTYEAGVTNSKRSPNNPVPDLLNRLEFTARYRNEDFSRFALDGGAVRIHRFDASAGVRF